MSSQNDVARARAEGMLFGVPMGALGIFQTLLMSFAAAFTAFFAVTFCGIVWLLVMTATGKHVDFAMSYKRGGLPVGLLVLVVALGYLGTLWVRRKVRKGN